MMKDTNLNDNTIMWFGEYKGLTLANVPASYLMFLYEKGSIYGGLLDYVKDNLEVLEMEIINMKGGYERYN